MKIIYFFTFDYSLVTWEKSGNLEKELEYFEYQNKKYNHEFVLITYGDKSDKKVIKNYEYIEIIPIYDYLLKPNNKVLRYVNSLRIPFILKNITGRFDIIKQNQLLGAWVSILFKLITKTPLIIRTGYDMFTFSKHDKKRLLVRALYYLLTQISIIFSSSYTVSSSVDKKFLKKYFLCSSKKISIVPNWIDDINFIDFNKRYQDRILCIGRFESQKNFEHLIRAFKDSKIQIDLYGDGSQKEFLLGLTKIYNVKVNFLGVLPYSNLKKIYSEYKIFVSTSLFEGNPKTILEAMSAGCVIVASNNPNNKEILSNEIDGILFDFQNNLKLIVENLFTNKEYLKTLSESSYHKVMNKNSLKIISDLDNDIMSEYKI